MMVHSTGAQEALARLVADQRRTEGVTAWCDAHRPDVELVVRELGVPRLAQAVGMHPPTLYGWAMRRKIPAAQLRDAGPSPEESAPPAAPPGPGAEPAPARASEVHLRSPRVVKQPGGAAPPQRKPKAYYEGLADGLKWALERLSSRP